MRRIPQFLLLLVGSLICGGLLYGAYAVARQEAIDNLNRQQAILARQASQGIQDLFEHTRDLTATLARSPHVIELDEEGRASLDLVLQEQGNHLRAISRMDEHGVLLFSTPDNSVAGRDVSHQEHVRRLLASHKATVSDVFTSVQGFRTVALHVPVFHGGQFRGSLAILLDFDSLAKQYLEGVRVAETGYAFVFSRQGYMLYSAVAGLPGRHYKDITKGFPALQTMVERMLRGESGTARYTFDRVRDREPEEQVKQAAYQPIRLEDTYWAIAVATPESEILVFLKRIFLYLLPLGLVTLGFTAFGVYQSMRRLGMEKEIALRRETEAALRESEERYRSVIENISDVFYRTDKDGIITMISPSGLRMSGLSSMAEIIGKPIAMFWRNAAEREQFLAMIEEHGVVHDFEVELGTSTGQNLFVATTSNYYHDKDGNVLGVEGIFRDISQRKQMEEQLRHRALHDPLTGLANRTLCLDRIAQANERARRRNVPGFAVVFIDLDRFKLINDSLGHEAGDLLLREAASRLLACTRRMDTVGRYGGDEFTLVLEELSARDVLRTVKRIRESFKTAVSIGGHNIQLEASFGVAYPPAEAIGPEDLLRNANIALHRAKQHGRNRVVVYKPSMHKAAIQVMSLESDIRQGLDRDEFYLLYQPIFELGAKRLCGFEALLRWRHPLRGLVGPDEFIPVAEESGSIFELGNLALSQGCMALAGLMRESPASAGLTLSVNLSPRQFARQGLTEQIDMALALSGLPPEALVLEITESSIMKHPEASANILSRIKARGVGIAIDDFGTGYSSMSALQRLPLDRLKIDRSFIWRLTDSHEDQEIVRAIITLARSLRLKTVAEGIETEAQRQILCDLGCDFGQGYLCSRPVDLEKIAELINPTVCALPGL